MSKKVVSAVTREKITANNKRTWNDKNIRAKRIAGINKAYYGSLSKEQYYNEIIRPLIYKGYTFMQMYKQKLISISNTSASNLYSTYGQADKEQVSINTKTGKSKAGKLHKGKTTPSKGKTYEQIYGEEKAKELREQRRKWLKENNIRRFATKVSKPQAILYSIVKQYFDTAVLEE
ncbi:MAG: hypothetical protein EBU90_27590, partial [Proteobacteria bacterium]|nr:hypothetical protein [Pseudomonadota bacterium]